MTAATRAIKEACMDYKWTYPLWSVTEGYALKTNQRLINGEVVQCYPDGDGMLWYYDKDGKEVHVE